MRNHKKLATLTDDTTKLEQQKTRNLFLLGFVSMFCDMSTEMVYPIIPLFLLSLGSTPFLIGVIEGIAEGLSAIIRAISGIWSDKHNSKKPLTIIGYSGAFLYKIGLLLSTSWLGVLVSRIVDKTGKGLRTAPRDALIAENGGKKLGRGFGLHKMFDMLGSALGVLFAFLILYFQFEYQSVIILSLIPAVLGVMMLFFVKEAKKQKPLLPTSLGALKQNPTTSPATQNASVAPSVVEKNEEPQPALNSVTATQSMVASPSVVEKNEEPQPALNSVTATQNASVAPVQTVKFSKQFFKNIVLDKRILFYLVIVFLFSMGNSSNAFLLLRAQDSGFSAQNVLLLYLIYNISASTLSIPFGKLSDKVGRKALLLSSYLLYGLVYLGFAFATKQASFVVLFVVYGVYAALIAGSERAMLVELAPPQWKGTVLGLSGTMQGFGLIVSSFTAGALWDAFGAKYAFVFGAALSLLAAFLLLFIKIEKPKAVAKNS